MRPRVTEPFTKAVIRVVPVVVSSLRVVAGLQRLISFPANSYSIKHIYTCIHFYSYSRIGTNENNMKTRRSVEHCTPHADGAWLNDLGWSQ